MFSYLLAFALLPFLSSDTNEVPPRAAVPPTPGDGLPASHPAAATVDAVAATLPANHPAVIAARTAADAAASLPPGHPLVAQTAAAATDAINAALPSNHPAVAAAARAEAVATRPTPTGSSPAGLPTGPVPSTGMVAPAAGAIQISGTTGLEYAVDTAPMTQGGGYLGVIRIPICPPGTPGCGGSLRIENRMSWPEIAERLRVLTTGGPESLLRYLNPTPQISGFDFANIAKVTGGVLGGIVGGPMGASAGSMLAENAVYAAGGGPAHYTPMRAKQHAGHVLALQPEDLPATHHALSELLPHEWPEDKAQDEEGDLSEEAWTKSIAKLKRPQMSGASYPMPRWFPLLGAMGLLNSARQALRQVPEGMEEDEDLHAQVGDLLDESMRIVDLFIAAELGHGEAVALVRRGPTSEEHGAWSLAARLANQPRPRIAPPVQISGLSHDLGVLMTPVPDSALNDDLRATVDQFLEGRFGKEWNPPMARRLIHGLFTEVSNRNQGWDRPRAIREVWRLVNDPNTWTTTGA